MKILYLGNKLSKHGFTPTNVETLGEQLKEFGQVKSVSDKRNKILRMLDMLFSVCRNARWADYVIIDTYSTSNFYFAFAAALLCRLFNIKFIPILHGGNLPARLDNSPMLSKAIFNHSYLNVAPSGYLFEEFRKRGYPNLRTIPNNIFIKEYTFKKRVAVEPKLLWVRAFDKIYNCEMAIEVLRSLHERYPNACLCMVGPDKDGSMQRVKDLAKEFSLEQQLLIPGKLSKEAWHTLAADYDIFINTTNFDNTPVSVIEAMALGLPVVSTNVGGIPYLVAHEQTGCLVAPGDIEGMCKAIENIVEHKAIAERLSAIARKKVEMLDWSVVKQMWKGVLC